MNHVMAWLIIAMTIGGLVAIASIRNRPFLPLVDGTVRAHAIAAIALALFATLVVAAFFVILP